MPIRSNPLASRADFAQLLLDIVRPLERFASPGGAFVKLGEDAAWYDRQAQWLEGFARPLWGLAPLHAGGGAYPGWERFTRGLASGSDRNHPEYWGPLGHGDQRAVEMAAIGVALALASDALWDPLPEAARARLARWLGRIESARMVDNNWHFFPVMAALGLERVGIETDAAVQRRHLDRIDGLYRGQGWYGDGRGHIDHYNGFAFHFYGLLYARLAGARDPVRAGRFADRAREFAPAFAQWFGDDGACLALGRSLTYRFATAAFWGALAFADVQALPWGQVRGLWARQIRWWTRQPVFDGAGLLSVGYCWPNLLMSEQYNSSASPYWALKAFLPLALPASHPFWTADEAPHPGAQGTLCVKPAGFLATRWEGDAVVLPAARPRTGMRNAPDKYAKFAYSSRFGMAVEAARWIHEGCCGDNILALSEDGKTFHAREDMSAARIAPDWIETCWSPRKGVRIATLQLFSADWELRIHQVATEVPLKSVEAGHAVGMRMPGEGAGLPRAAGDRPRDRTRATAKGLHGERSAIACLRGAREASMLPVMPNTHLVHSRAVVPVLRRDLTAGTTLLVTAVRASADPAADLDPPADALLQAAQAAMHAAGWNLGLGLDPPSRIETAVRRSSGR